MVGPKATFSPEDELAPGFREAQAWFFANEDEMEQREEILAQEIAQVLGGRMRPLRDQLDTVGQLASAKNWSKEMRQIEFDRAIGLAVEQLRRVPGVERAISAAQWERQLPEKVLAALPEALSEVRRTHPDAMVKKGSVVRELQKLLASKHERRVSAAQIARAMPADFASRN